MTTPHDFRNLWQKVLEWRDFATRVGPRLLQTLKTKEGLAVAWVDLGLALVFLAMFVGHLANWTLPIPGLRYLYGWWGYEMIALWMFPLQRMVYGGFGREVLRFLTHFVLPVVLGLSLIPGLLFGSDDLCRIGFTLGFMYERTASFCRASETTTGMRAHLIRAGVGAVLWFVSAAIAVMPVLFLGVALEPDSMAGGGDNFLMPVSSLSGVIFFTAMAALELAFVACPTETHAFFANSGFSRSAYSRADDVLVARKERLVGLEWLHVPLLPVLEVSHQELGDNSEWIFLWGLRRIGHACVRLLSLDRKAPYNGHFS